MRKTRGFVYPFGMSAFSSISSYSLLCLCQDGGYKTESVNVLNGTLPSSDARNNGPRKRGPFLFIL